MSTEDTWFEITARDAFERNLSDFADQPLRCLQLGAFTGDASVWLMENLPLATLVDVDTWAGSEEHENFDFADVLKFYNSRMLPWRDRVDQCICTTAFFFVANERPEPFDFVYVDADHRAPSVLADAIGAFALTRVGGLIAFDDYIWVSGLGRRHEPRLAIDAFCDIYAELIDVVDRGSQCWVRKLREA